MTNNGAVLKARPMTRNKVVEEVNCLGKGVEDFVHVYLVSMTQIPCEKMWSDDAGWNVYFAV